MSKEVLENYKSLIIEVLNENIRLNEAIGSKSGLGGGSNIGTGKSMGGVGSSANASKTNEVDNILMGSQKKALDLGPEGAIGLATGGKLAGVVGRAAGQLGANKLADILGGGGLGKYVGGAAGGLLSKVFTDIETLSGAPSFEAQIKNIAPKQVALRWEGSGSGGWFDKLVPKTTVKPIEAKSSKDYADEADKQRTAARMKRLQDIELSKKERRYGLPPI
jgi:hypothetical protein